VCCKRITNTDMPNIAFTSSSHHKRSLSPTLQAHSQQETDATESSTRQTELPLNSWQCSWRGYAAQSCCTAICIGFAVAAQLIHTSSTSSAICTSSKN
jgi:hypothetical protein